MALALSQRRQQFLPDRRTGSYPPAVSEPDYITILFEAFDEACAFLGIGSVPGAARREEVARVIIANARCGLLDPHRLALKAIVKVG